MWGGEKMKVKSLVPKKKIKYNQIKFNLDISKPIVQDTDSDGLPDFIDCNPTNPNEQGALHDWLQKQRLLKERKQMAKLDIEPLKEEQEHFDEELSKAETSIQHFKGQVEEVAGEMKGNVREGLKGTDKNFSGIARGYTRRAEHVPKQRKPQHYREGEIAVKSQYLIPPPRKMFLNEETGERSSIPHYKRDKYIPFKPHTTGYIFHPHRAPNPLWLVEKQRQRELARLYLRLQAIQKAQGGQ